MSPCGHGQSFGQLPVPVNADLAQSLVNALRQSAQQAEAPGWGGGVHGSDVARVRHSRETLSQHAGRRANITIYNIYVFDFLNRKPKRGFDVRGRVAIVLQKESL